MKPTTPTMPPLKTGYEPEPIGKWLLIIAAIGIIWVVINCLIK